MRNAIIDNDVNAVDRLLNTDVNVNAQYEGGWTALMYAAEYGHVNIVNRLLDTLGIQVDAQNVAGLTALMIAAENGHDNVVSRLIQAGINVNAQNVAGWTALMYAAENRHANVVAILLRASGINVNIRNQEGRTACDLFNFSRPEHAEILELFLRHKAIRRNIQGVHPDIAAVATNNLSEDYDEASLRHASDLGFDLGYRIEEIVVSRQGHSPVIAASLNAAAEVAYEGGAHERDKGLRFHFAP